MTKERFLKIIDLFQFYQKKSMECTKLMDEFEPMFGDIDLIDTISNKALSMLMEILIDDMKDIYEMISWWIYETNFGKENYEIYNEDGTIYKSILTAEDLYDYLEELQDEESVR